jgi:hypothetical protein
MNTARPGSLLRLLSVCALLGLVTACPPRPHVVPPAAGREWPEALRHSLRFAATGDYGSADTALTNFARAHAGTLEADEAEYWRAVLQLDPGNRAGSARDALGSLDAYLASTQPIHHRTEAATMRSLLARRQALERSLDEARASAASATAAVEARERAQSGELQQLRDSLQQASAELERIKKRLSARRP